MSNKKIAVLIGCSAEYEVSLMTASGVTAALDEKGYSHITADIDAYLPSILLQERPDAVFIASHGGNAEDGRVQGLLDILGVPYVGSGVLASSLAMSKHKAKLIFQQMGLRTPEFSVVSGDAYGKEQLDMEFELMKHGGVVVKPEKQGSSIGISMVTQVEDLQRAIEDAFAFDSLVMIERMIRGVELSVPVLGDKELTVLPCIEIAPKNTYYDYEAKYTPGMSDHLIPPRVEQCIIEEAQSMAIAAHRALGCRDLSRSDFMVDEHGCWLLEVNTLPGMTPTSLVPDAARALGWSYADLIDKLIRMALDRA